MASGNAYLTDDRVVSGGDRVEDAVDALQRLLALHVDAVVRLVVVLQRATAQTVNIITKLHEVYCDYLVSTVGAHWDVPSMIQNRLEDFKI